MSFEEFANLHFRLVITIGRWCELTIKSVRVVVVQEQLAVI